jgi:hypothetical protein
MKPINSHSAKKSRLARNITEDILMITGSGVNLTAETIEQINKAIESRIASRRNTYAKRYPTSTAIVAILGVILTYYGVENLINNSDYLSEHPIVILVMGIFLLVVTGRLIKQSYAS